MAVVRQKAGLAGVQRVGAWLYRIAVRQVLMYRRATGRRRKLLQRVQSDAASAVQLTEPLSVMLHDEAQSRVRQALAELGEVERQLLLLKYAEGWSYRQIAERLGVQEVVAVDRLRRALPALHGLGHVGRRQQHRVQEGAAPQALEGVGQARAHQQGRRVDGAARHHHVAGPDADGMRRVRRAVCIER